MIATLLDFDGVLVDSEPVHLAAFNDVLAGYGITIGEREYFGRLISLDDAGVLRTVLSRGGRTLREEDVRAVVAAKAQRFMVRFEEAFRVFPGASELVARRAARGPVGIVSGALHREIAFALDRMGVARAVAFILGAERNPASTPDPVAPKHALYSLALDELRRIHHAGPAVVVEDSVGGVVSAKRAGLRCVAVTHSHARAELQAAGADTVVEDLASLSDEVLELAP